MIRLLCDSVGRIIMMIFRTCCDESSCCSSYMFNKQQMFRLEVIFCHNDSSIFMGVFKVIQRPFMPEQSCLLIYKSPDWSRNGFACLENQFDWHLNWITWTRCAFDPDERMFRASLSSFVGQSPSAAADPMFHCSCHKSWWTTWTQFIPSKRIFYNTF
jgi:hypothetical protein